MEWNTDYYTTRASWYSRSYTLFIKGCDQNCTITSSTRSIISSISINNGISIGNSIRDSSILKVVVITSVVDEVVVNSMYI